MTPIALGYEHAIVIGPGRMTIAFDAALHAIPIRWAPAVERITTLCLAVGSPHANTVFVGCAGAGVVAAAVDDC